MLTQIVLLASWSEALIEPSTATGVLHYIPGSLSNNTFGLAVTRGRMEGKEQFLKGGEEAWLSLADMLSSSHPQPSPVHGEYSGFSIGSFKKLAIPPFLGQSGHPDLILRELCSSSSGRWFE